MDMRDILELLTIEEIEIDNVTEDNVDQLDNNNKLVYASSADFGSRFKNI